MTLTGTHMNSLAAALAAAHPDVERLDITHDDLRALLRGLAVDCAVDALTPGELSVIKWMWMRHADGPELLTASGGGG